jgi:hypothetical protein
VDRDKSVSISDFYDCGGGFYFTLLVGSEGENSRPTTTNEDTGWLIGEGVVDRGELKGTIEFYPYYVMPGPPGLKKASPPVIQAWTPRSVKP